MLMGEYAVTQTGHPGIVAAVDRYVTAVVEPAERYHLELPTLETTITTADWPSLLVRLREDARLTLVLRVMVLIHRYVREAGQRLAPFRVTVTNTEMQTPTGIKYGLGSSAAISVAISAALLGLCLGRDPSRDTVFKFAATAHAWAQGGGSGADVAACTFGGVILYWRYDADWLRSRFHEEPLHHVMDRRWPELRIESLPTALLPSWFVGWTGQAVSTPSLLRRMQAFRQREPKAFSHFLDQSDRSVGLFVDAIRSGHHSKLLEAIRANRQALRYLADIGNLSIETNVMTWALDAVEQLGGAGKSSGAGGGDVILAWLRGGAGQPLGDVWRGCGIENMDVSHDEKGVVYMNSADL